MPHLFVDISSHGFGHLAQTAPVLAALRERLPGLRLTIRSGLPRERIAARVGGDFEHLAAASDFGFAMHDALAIDHAATRARYAASHAGWATRVDAEAEFLAALRPDFVLANVAYLPLAGAARIGIPAAAMCSLHWSALFDHFYAGRDTWSRTVGGQIADAYAAAPFLALEPCMPLPGPPGIVTMPPVAAPGRDCRAAIERATGRHGARLVLVAFGGIPTHLPAERWPRRNDMLWLVPEAWTEALGHPACRAFEPLGLAFTDLLASVDAVVTKPGYGTFVEAAALGTPVLYVRRPDWPEQEALIAWLHRHAPARELTAGALAADAVEGELDALWALPAPARPVADGAPRVAAWLEARLGPAIRT